MRTSLVSLTFMVLLLSALCLILPACGGGGGGGGAAPIGTAVQITGVQPSTTITGTMATFTALVTGTAPLTYAWDFGGGATPNTSTAASPSAALAVAGTYTGTVTVDNTFGAPAVYTFTLTVVSGGGGGGGGTFPTDAAQLAWVTTWYTTLPGLGNSNRVFQDATHRGLADDVLTRMNQERATAGQAALAWEPHMEALAQAHSTHMATSGFFAHTNPEGLIPTDRLEAIDPVANSMGMAENIGAGYQTASVAMTAWMGSAVHRDNILDSRWTHAGVAAYTRAGDPQGYGIYWTVTFIQADADPAAHAWIEPGDTP